LPQYKVIKFEHFNPDKAKLFPKEIKIEVANQHQDLGHSSVVVDRREGVATITTSSKSSATVIGEVIHLVVEYVNRSVLTDFKSYAFNVRWETDHYQINLTEHEDWSGDWTPES
jgi:endo-alpha-1,4-polygalactosaminidase (GH114 family)